MDKRLFLAPICVTMILACVSFFSGISFAQPPEGGMQMPAWMSSPDGPEKLEAFMKAEDKDGDGKVARDEFKGPDMLWNQWDTNKDGFIEPDEAPSTMPKMKMPEFVDDGKPRGPHIEGGASGEEFMEQFDLDKDGRISHSEWETVRPNTVYRQKHWPSYDKNRDMSITPEEAPQKEDGSEPAPE